MESVYFTEAHEAARESIRRFLVQNILPNTPMIEQEGRIPRNLWQELGQAGYFAIGHDENFGGSKSDIFGLLVLMEEMARSGLGGLCESLLTHGYLSLGYIDKYGSRFLKRNYLSPGIRGEKIGAMGLTAPPLAGDTSLLKVTARLERQYYCLQGNIGFVSNGGHADFFVIAARTDPQIHPGGLSLFVVDRDLPGIRTHATTILGWRSADVAELHLDNVKVPTIQLIGQENMGMYYLNEGYLLERLLTAAIAVTQADYCLENTLRYLQQRHSRRPAYYLPSRYPIAALVAELEAIRQLVYYAAWLYEEGLPSIKQCTMAKLQATELLKKTADFCLQVIGKNALRENSMISTLFRDAHLAPLSHGASEMMLEIIARLVVDRRTDVAESPVQAMDNFAAANGKSRERETGPPESEKGSGDEEKLTSQAGPAAGVPPLSAEVTSPVAPEPLSADAEPPAPETPAAESREGKPQPEAAPETPVPEEPQPPISQSASAEAPETPPENPPGEAAPPLADAAPPTPDGEGTSTAGEVPAADQVKSGLEKFSAQLLSDEEEEEWDELDSDLIAAMERAFARQQSKMEKEKAAEAPDVDEETAAEPDPPAPPPAPETKLPDEAPATPQAATDAPTPREAPEPIVVRQPLRNVPAATTANESDVANGETHHPANPVEGAPPETPIADAPPPPSPPTAEQQVREIMFSLPHRFDGDRAADFRAVIQYQIIDSGEVYSVALENGQCTVSDAPAEKPSCIVKTTAQTLIDMESGKINPQVAFMMGRMEISNVPQMMHFVKLLRKTASV